MVSLLRKLLKKFVAKNMRKALLIGINNYPRGKELKGCIEDINDVRAVLEKNGDGSDNFDIEMLPDVQTKREAMQSIRHLFDGDGEMSILYFSGHGYVNDTDAELAFPDGVSHNDYYYGIKMSDIMGIVHRSKVRNKIIILDCCHSGALGKFHLNHNESLIGPGVSVLSACREHEVAVEHSGHGIFTIQLCNALAGGAADFCGNITIGGIYAFIDRVFGPHEQRPTFKTNVTEFAPIRKVNPKVSIDIIKLLTSFFNHSTDEFLLDPSFEFDNTPDKPTSVKPYAVDENVKKFKALQQLASIGFVAPTGEEHMYYAAMNHKSCHLTNVGRYYWELVKNNQL